MLVVDDTWDRGEVAKNDKIGTHCISYTGWALHCDTSNERYTLLVNMFFQVYIVRMFKKMFEHFIHWSHKIMYHFCFYTKRQI